MIYFLVVNYYSTPLVEKLMVSIFLNQEESCQVIIVNNSPDDRSIHRLSSDSIIILEAGENLGFGKGCNLGLNWIYQQNYQGIIWLINPDAYLGESSLKQASLFLKNHPEVSILGTVVYQPTGEVWFGGGDFIVDNGTIIAKNYLSAGLEVEPYITVEWVTGCSLIINLKKFTNCPQFDSDYFLYYEDFDFCKRYAKEGHIIGLTKEISVIHQPSSITGTMPKAKIKHSTYSYLLTLEKHTSKLVLLYRLMRITVSALISLPKNSTISINELKGVFGFVVSALARLALTTNKLII
ncbi:glycosyl transferase [Oscillatoriales cyanobacterium USR001]|nr:glycosyl transferase [Oscillatoriales cyanobacterium USR001]